MRSKSILTEAKQISRAVALIGLGARLQVLESETDLSYERLLRLYKEVAGKSPSKGQLPFSTDWFMTWQPNIHASLFLNMHEYLNKVAELDEIDTVIKAYQLYMEQTQAQGLEPLLSVTRAWRLVKFIDNGMLTMTRCNTCGGHFITHPHEIARHFTCGLCNPPARAGKGKAAGSIRIPSGKGEVAACIAEAALDAPVDAGIEALQAHAGAAPAAARGPRKPARKPAGETRLH
jgi:flagellar transcriptional activator FlhC